ncbi:MAG: tryptophan synthase subunit alpha [Candidatus Jacksonbacteria bacterium]
MKNNLPEKFIAMGFVPGYPSLGSSYKIAEILIKNKIDVLEFSASFSEPVADGPVLAKAHQEVIKNKISKKQIFDFYKKLRQSHQNQFFFVIEYANIIYHTGIENYYKKLAQAKINALLIPDVPLEEIGPYKKMAEKYNVGQVLIVSPNLKKDHILEIAKVSEPFIYLTAVTGVTGKRKTTERSTLDFIKNVRKLTKKPLIVGFGIQYLAQAKQIFKAGAAGIVICSKLVGMRDDYKRIEKYSRKFSFFLTFKGFV